MLLPVALPEFGRPVKVVIKPWSSWTFKTDVILKSVDEDDCSWRFVDDNSELSYDYDVIFWEYVNPVEERKG